MAAPDDLDGPEPPNTLMMGGRLRFERERLKLSLAEAAHLVGISEKAFAETEAALGSRGAALLTEMGRAGADVLYIVTGTRNTLLKEDGRPAADRFRRALAEMPGVERQRLLFHLVSEELGWLVSQRL